MISQRRRFFLVLTLAGSAAAYADAEPRIYDLKLAVQTALSKHPALRTADARSQAARTAIAVAGARNRPAFEGHASVGRTLAGDRNFLIREDVVGQGFGSDPFYTAFVSFVSPIVREGGLTFTTLPSEEIAAARYAAVKYAEDLTRDGIVNQVTVAYFAVLSAKAEVEIGEQLLALSRTLRDSVRLKFRQQLLPQADVLAAEAALASAKADLEGAQASLANARGTFANALGVDPSSGASLDLKDEDQPPAAIPPLGDLLVRAVGLHPSVLVQSAKVREALATLERLRTERYPTLDAVTSIGEIDDFSPPVDGWSLRALLRVDWKIFDFGALDLQIQQQAEALRAEQLALEQLKTQVAQPVLEAYRNLTSNQSRLAAAEKSVKLTEELARVARHRSRQDLIPDSELLRAEVNLAAARKSLVQAKNTLRINYAMLQFAIGE